MKKGPWPTRGPKRGRGLLGSAPAPARLARCPEGEPLASQRQSEQVAEPFDATENHGRGELAGVEMFREFGPRERCRHRRARRWPERVRGDDLLALAVHLRVDEDPVTALGGPLAGHEPA